MFASRFHDAAIDPVLDYVATVATSIPDLHASVAMGLHLDGPAWRKFIAEKRLEGKPHEWREGAAEVIERAVAEFLAAVRRWEAEAWDLHRRAGSTNGTWQAIQNATRGTALEGERLRLEDVYEEGPARKARDVEDLLVYVREERGRSHRPEPAASTEQAETVISYVDAARMLQPYFPGVTRGALRGGAHRPGGKYHRLYAARAKGGLQRSKVVAFVEELRLSREAGIRIAQARTKPVLEKVARLERARGLR